MPQRNNAKLWIISPILPGSLYYGAADAYTAGAEFSERELLDAMIAPD